VTSVTNLYNNHFNIIIVIYYLLSVVKTNAEMFRFRISCGAIVNTPRPIQFQPRDQPTSQIDRQTDRGHYSASHGKMDANTVT